MQKRSYCTGASDRRVGTTVAMFSGQKESEGERKRRARPRLGPRPRRGKTERLVNLAKVARPRAGMTEKKEKGGKKCRGERGARLDAPRELAVYKGPPYCGYVLSC